jgi:hypothetical protein
MNSAMMGILTVGMVVLLPVPLRMAINVQELSIRHRLVLQFVEMGREPGQNSAMTSTLPKLMEVV